MGELPKKGKVGHTYPVKIQAIDVGWIFNEECEDHALEFIDGMLELDNLEVFKVKGVQIIIEFLYKNF